jgi:hypothetical protein
MRDAAKMLHDRGIEISKSELHRQMPGLIDSGIITGHRNRNGTGAFQLTDSDISALEFSFKGKPAGRGE